MESSTATRAPSSPSPKFQSRSAVSRIASSPSGAGTPATLLSGFVAQDSWAAVQESVYVVIGHGQYQYHVLLCGILATTVALLHILSDSFLMRPLDHWCRPPDKFIDMSADAWKNMSIPVEADGTFTKCAMYDPATLDYPAANRSVVPCHGWDYDIANRGDSVISRFNLVCNRVYLSNIRAIVAIIVCGLVSPLLGFASDRVGRRPVMLGAVFVLLVGAVGGSVAETITFHIFARVLVLVGFNGTFLLTFILLYEVTGNARRALFTLTDTAIASIVAPPIVEAVAALEPRWALSQAFFLVPTLTLAACCSLLDESPVWLLAMRDMKRAEVAVIAAAEENGVDTLKARATFQAIRRQLRKMERSPETSLDIAVAAEHFLQAAKTHRRAASVFLAMFTLSAVSFTFFSTQKTEGLYWLTAETSILAACFGAASWAMTSFGIRETLSAFLVIMCVGLIVEAFLIYLALSITIPFAHLGTKVAAFCAISLVHCYSAEIFPTGIRSAGVSMCLLFRGCGSLLGAVFVAIKGQAMGVAFCALSAMMASLTVWAIQWLPEVFVETAAQKTGMSDQERKETLKKYLTPIEGRRRHRRHKRKSKSPPKSPH